MVLIPGIPLYFFYGRKKTERKGVIGIRSKRSDIIHNSNIILPSRKKLEDFQSLSDAYLVTVLFGYEYSAEDLVEKGMALAGSKEIEVAYLMEIPEQTDLNDIAEENNHLRSVQRRLTAMAVEKKRPIEFDPIATHDVLKTIFEISQRLHCEWLLIEWRKKQSDHFTFNSPIGWLKNHLHCNFAIYKDAGVRYFKKILIYLNSEGHDKLAVTTARHLSNFYKADISILCFHDPKEKEKRMHYAYEISQNLNTLNKVQVLERMSSQKETDQVLRQASGYDLLIMGDKTHTFRDNFNETKQERIMRKSACSVISLTKCL